MAKINLLPWRDERRKQQQRQFNSMLGLSVLVGLFIAVVGYLYYQGQVTGQMQRNDLLRQEIASVKKINEEIAELEKRRDSLLSRKKVIEELQGLRYEMVKLFSTLAETIADGAQITSIEQNGADLTIIGRAQSNARVSNYMKNIMASPILSNPDLSIIEAKGTDRSLPYEFTLNAKMKQIASVAEQLPLQDASAAPAATAEPVPASDVQGGAK
jgi:type IV pilus assembly protein PilN